MNIIKYQALVKVIENNSLTKAAEQLGYTQPGISHMIASLEKEMGFPLFIRSKEGIQATPELSLLIPHIRQILTSFEMINQTIAQIKGSEIGTIRIGTFYSIAVQWLPSVIQSFSQKYPNIELQLYEGDKAELTRWLLDNMIDFALMAAPAPDSCEFYPICEDPVMAVLPSNHPLALSSSAEIAPEEMVQYPFILPYEGSDEDYIHILKEKKLTPKVRFRIKGDETVLAMISQNLGVTLMPALLLKRLPENVIIKPLTSTYTRKLGIGIRSRKNASPAAKLLLEEMLSS